MLNAKKLLGKLFSPADYGRRQTQRARLQLEELEDRRVPSTLSGSLCGSDSDPAGDTFHGGVSGNFDGSNVSTSFQGSLSGDTATGNMNGTVSAGTFSGTFSIEDQNTGVNLTGTATGTISGTTFSGTISGTDPQGYAVSGTFTINVTPQAIMVASMAYDVLPNQTLQITNAGQGLISDAYDPQGNPLTVSGFTQPANGSVTVNPDGTFQYTAGAGFTGLDSFTYTVSDGTLTTTATATVVVGTSIWTDATGDGQWSTAGNWLGGVVPTAQTNVVFDGNYSNADCDFTGTSIPPGNPIPDFAGGSTVVSQSGTMCNSLTIINNYEGTLQLEEASAAQIGPGGINQSSGDIEQDSGQDIDNAGSYNWSGGEINVNSPFLADVVQTTAGRGFNWNGDGRQLTTGSNVDLTNGAIGVLNLPDGGSLEFTKNAGISIDNQSSFNWIDGSLETQQGNTGIINNAGTFTKSIGAAIVVTQLPIENSGNFSLQQGWIFVKNQATMNGVSGLAYLQTAGTTTLSNQTSLCLPGGDFVMQGGNFYTDGKIADISAQTGQGSVSFEAGIINLNHSNQNATGDLTVFGTLYIEGTTEWDCKVNCTPGGIANNQYSCDEITVTGNANILDYTTFKAIAINVPQTGVPVTQQGQPQPTWNYLVVRGKNRTITGVFATYFLTFNDGTGGSWTNIQQTNNNVWAWVVDALVS
jgi:hypothetical protein